MLASPKLAANAQARYEFVAFHELVDQSKSHQPGAENVPRVKPCAEDRRESVREWPYFHGHLIAWVDSQARRSPHTENTSAVPF